MTIPERYQVFDGPVYVSSKDAERLTLYLTSKEVLFEYLSGIAEPDLLRLVLMELCGKRRRRLIDRILMRLGRVQRRKIEARITKCLTQVR